MGFRDIKGKTARFLASKVDIITVMFIFREICSVFRVSISPDIYSVRRVLVPEVLHVKVLEAISKALD